MASTGVLISPTQTMHSQNGNPSTSLYIKHCCLIPPIWVIHGNPMAPDL